MSKWKKWETKKPISLKNHEPSLPITYLASAISKPESEWIITYNGNGWNDYWDYTCPYCGRLYKRADGILYDAHYCPNCGMRMKGKDNE